MNFKEIIINSKNYSNLRWDRIVGKKNVLKFFEILPFLINEKDYFKRNTLRLFGKFNKIALTRQLVGDLLVREI